MTRRLLFSLMLCVGIIAQAYAQRTISGTVIGTDDDLGLPGVSVIIKGTATGTVTDINGKYELTAKEGDVLVFQYVGFLTQEVTVGTSNVIDVQLANDVKQLEEIVVTGYGEQIKAELTGNIAQIKSEAIEGTPVPSFEQAIQGRAAGVFVESENGKVGGGIKMRIRGASSITAGNEPLYVVDGVVVTTESQSRTDARTNPLADINFNDIESIEILKDASAAAIYGARAANGVVLITTKQGKAGKTKFNLSYKMGTSSPTNKREWLNAAEYIELFSEAAYNSDLLEGFDPINNPDDYPFSWLEFAEGRFDRYSGHSDWRTGETDTNWEDEIYQDAGFQQIDLSISGGDERSRFYISGSYSDQEGILIGNSFERMSGRMNLDHKVNKKMSVGLNLSLSRTVNDRVADDNEFSTPVQLIALSPITPIRDLDGNLYDRPTTTYYNGLVENENADFLTSVFRTLGNAYASYELTDGLTLRGEFGVDLLNQNEDRFQGSQTLTGQGIGGYGSSRWVQIVNYTTKAYLNYDKEVSEGHDLNVVGGIEYQNRRRDQTNAEAQGFPLDELQKLTSAAEKIEANSTLFNSAFVSYFARANYKLKDKYLLGLSGRIDGSSRFGDNSRYGFFPAVSAGWIISEEAFLAGGQKLSFLKLRASYGLTGNANIPDFAFAGLYDSEGYAGVSGLQPSQLPNPDLRWEKTAQLDIGIDFGLFNDRVSGEIDYYVKNTSDLLLNTPVPGTSGFSTTLLNIGEMQNRGFELVINTTNTTGPLKWSTSFNFARNINEVKKLAGDQELIDSSSSRWLNVVKVGEPIGVFFGREYAGVDPENGDALWFVNDPDGAAGATTNNFNDANRVILGDPNPDFIGGITNNLSYKGIDLSFLFQFVYGNEIFNGGGGFQSANAEWFDNQSRDQLNRWQNPGDITDVPQARLGYVNGSQASSRYLSDGSYIRLKNVTLGYNLPKEIAEKAFLSNARIYVTAQNLLTFTSYEGWDPEVNTDYRAGNINQGNDFYSAPQARTIVFGINLGF